MIVILIVPDDCYFDRTWWLLFKKRVVLTKLDIYVFITRLIEKRKCKQLAISPI